MTMDINAALGETQEYTRDVVLPASLYPVKLTIVDVGVSDVREDGGGGTPYVELNADIYDGPFKGRSVRKRVYISAGKKGGYLGLFAGWNKSITRQPANASAFAKFGLTLPAQQPGQDDKEYKAEVRALVADWWQNLGPDERLAFVDAYLALKAWNGKQVLTSLSVEEGTRPDGTPRPPENRFNGMYPLDDKQKGMAFYKAVIEPQQRDAHEQMSAAGLLS